MSGGFEPFHDFFAPPGRQMRILRPIVQPLVLAMLEIHAHSRSGGSIGTELVGNHHPWRARLPADEFAQELFRRAAIPAALNQSVENKAICVDGAPKPMLLAVDGDHDFVEMPFVAEPWGATADLVGVDPPEFLRPAPHGFVADDDPARRQQVLDHSQAERKPEIQPNRLLDDLGRKPMAAINGFRRRVHRAQIATNRQKVANLTVPAETRHSLRQSHFRRAANSGVFQHNRRIVRLYARPAFLPNPRLRGGVQRRPLNVDFARLLRARRHRAISGLLRTEGRGYRVKRAPSFGVAIPHTRAGSGRSPQNSTMRREGMFVAETSS